MKKLLMIVNPNAGKSQVKGNLTNILDTFIKAGYRVEIYITQGPADATRIAAQWGAGVDRVVCTGGDGTLDEVVNGLMQIPEEQRPELGYISAGTTNDYAHSLHIPSRMVEAASIAAYGDVRRMDLGQANDQFFTYVFGFGSLTDISYVTPQELKKVLGHQAYIIEGAKQLVNMKGYTVKVEADDQVFEGNFICGLISNSERIGGMAGLWGKDIQMDDGVLEITLLREPTNVVGWGDLATSFVSANDASEYVIHARAKHVRLTTPEPISWVKDGEFGGEHRVVEIDCLHHALTMVLPTAEDIARQSEWIPLGIESILQ